MKRIIGYTKLLLLLIAGALVGCAPDEPVWGHDLQKLYAMDFPQEQLDELGVESESIWIYLGTHTQPKVSDKTYKEAIFKAIKEEIAYVENLHTAYDYKTFWKGYYEYDWKYESWDELLETALYDYSDEDKETADYQFRRLHGASVYLIGLSLEGILGPAYQSIVFNEFVFIHHRIKRGENTSIREKVPTMVNMYGRFKNRSDDELRSYINTLFTSKDKYTGLPAFYYFRDSLYSLLKSTFYQ